MLRRNTLVTWVIAAGLQLSVTGCGPSFLDLSAGYPPVTRSEAMAIAEQYASHEWMAGSQNIFRGRDGDGISVRTPAWTVGQVNRGIAYQWDGFVSIAEFDAGLTAGKFAGDVDTNKPDASRYAVGVDCSGLVSRCWKVPVKHSTRSLPGICVRLPDAAELRPGDILDYFDAHVVLFKEFTDPGRSKIRCYEARGGKVTLAEYDLAAMLREGFKPYRYKRITD
jgi:hypothetical protein